MHKTNCREIHPILYTAAKKSTKRGDNCWVFWGGFLRNIILHYK